MSAPRARIGVDQFGATVYAEAKDDYLVISTQASQYSGQVVLFPEAYAALVKYVEQARAVV